MNIAEANDCILFFTGLYPLATLEQKVALRDAIYPYELARFKPAAKTVMTRCAHANEAIPALVRILEDEKQAAERIDAEKHGLGGREMSWNDGVNERVADECFARVLDYALDDAWIESAPPEVLNSVLTELIAEQAEPIRSIWTKKGLAFRAVRCAVAARLVASRIHASEPATVLVGGSE